MTENRIASLQQDMAKLSVWQWYIMSFARVLI